MYKLSVENVRGELLSLTDNKNYTVTKIDGLNPPPATINQSSNSTTDGGKINSARLESRNIVIYININGNIEANRISLYKYFPVKGEIALYFSNGTRDVYIKGTVEVIECDLFSNNQVAQVSIICPKPYFNDVDYLITNFNEISSLFEFPFSMTENGTELSMITSNIRKSIINTGDVETGVIIKLFAIGTVVNPVIYDTLKRIHMKLNFTMESSDTIVINTNVGEKSIELIRNGVSSNAMGYMSLDSNWFTLLSGDNVFTYSADEGSSNLQISFTTSVLYSGV